MVLVHLGYLSYDIDSKSVYIPNEEVREEFIRAVTTGKLSTIGKSKERGMAFYGEKETDRFAEPGAGGAAKI